MNRLRPVTVYLMMQAAASLLFSMVFTVMTVYRVESVHLNEFQLVLIGTVLELSYFLFEIPTGVLADTYSRRLSVVLGFILIGAGYVLEGLIPLFMAGLLAQVIAGLGYGFSSGASEAWISDEIGQENVGTVFMRGTQVGLAAGIVGIMTGSLLASLRLNLPIVLGSASLIILGVLLAFVMTEHGFQPAPRNERTRLQSMRDTFRAGIREIRVKPILVTLMGITLLYGAFTEGFDRLWQAHFLKNFEFPNLLAPVIWFGVMGVVAQLLGLAVTEITRRRIDSGHPLITARILGLINVVMIVSIVLFGLAGNFAVAVIAYWTITLTRTIRGPLYTTWLTQNIESKVRATVISMSEQADSIGQIVGGPVIGAIATWFSLRAVMVLAGIILAPGILLYRRAVGYGSVDMPRVETNASEG